jgi:hypothetical protein
MLIYNQEAKTLSKRVPVPGAAATVLQKNVVDLGQIKGSPDGRRITAVAGAIGSRTSQVVTMDLHSGAVTPISPPSGWADLQWPSWSPSGRHIAWQQSAGTNKKPRAAVMVDGKAVAEDGTHTWLSDSTLALSTAKALVVLDLSTGRELGHVDYPPSK